MNARIDAGWLSGVGVAVTDEQDRMEPWQLAVVVAAVSFALGIVGGWVADVVLGATW